ncbi:transposase [Elusimicrobiota bacterium]
MPRPPRLDFPGACHHVIARGDNREALFREPEDYRAYLRELFESLIRFRVALHAYCLMTNHLHLLLQTSDAGLPDLMSRFHGWYARRFNSKYSRVGHVFKDRYSSKLVADNAYILELSRYIHMNPVAAGLAFKPQEYEWSSFRSHLAGRCRPPLSPIHAIPRFGESDRFDRRSFFKFTTARHDFDCSPEDWLNDGGLYLDSTVAPGDPTSIERWQDCTERATPEEIVAGVAKVFQCTEERVLNGWKDPSLAGARGAAMLLLREVACMTLREIALKMGIRHEANVSRAISTIRPKADSNPALRSLRRRLLPLS